MSSQYHTRASDACQQPQPQTATTDRRLVTRYGAAALDAGYAAIPHVVIRRRRALGITAAEWDYICEVWSYWRADRLPGPSVDDLARGLGVDQSTIRRHRASLERKGLLRVVPTGPYNRYDLRPLIDAAVGLDRAQADTDDRADDRAPAQGSRNSPPADRAEVRPTKEVEKKLDYDSIPPYPPLHGNTRVRTTTDDSREGTHISSKESETAHDTDDGALAAEIASLSVELGDDAPVSSVTRADNLRRAAGVSVNRFLTLLGEAAARTRDRQGGIVKRRRDGQTSNGMPYLFAVLQDLVRPAPRTRDVGPHATCRRASPPHRGRRRVDGRGEFVGSYAVWSDTPDRLPITEEHPIWRAALNELAAVLTTENFNTWLATTRVVAQEGEVLRVAVPAAFNKTWLEQKLHGKVTGALHRIDYNALGVGRVARVEYVVEVAA